MQTDKRCGYCETTKPISEFHRNSSARDGLQARCKLCSNEARRDWAAKNPERADYHRKRDEIKHADRIKATKKSYYAERIRPEQKARLNSESLEKYHFLRTAALNHLGGKCFRCGYSDLRGLNIEHLNSDGADERRNLHQYQIHKLVLASVPGTRYSVACATCNQVLRHERGEIKIRAEE